MKAQSPIEFILSLNKQYAINERLVTQKELNKRFKGNFTKWQKSQIFELKKGSLYIDMDKIPCAL